MKHNANNLKRAKKLREDSRLYHHQDPKWRANFRRRVRQLTSKIDPKTDDGENALAIMLLDHISLEVAMAMRWRQDA